MYFSFGLLTVCSLQTEMDPKTVELACQAVNTVSDERNSEALLNGSTTGELEDPDQSNNKAEHLPDISNPFAQRIEHGEHGYPTESIGRETGNNM